MALLTAEMVAVNTSSLTPAKYPAIPATKQRVARPAIVFGMLGDHFFTTNNETATILRAALPITTIQFRPMKQPTANSVIIGAETNPMASLP